MATVRTSVESARGCGYRKGGGLYLCSGELSEPCPKLPIALDVCPTCGAGVKPSRGWTWITVEPLLEPSKHGSARHNSVCPLGSKLDWSDGKRCGLIWIGEKFYPTVGSFQSEATSMGVSRRIRSVPRDFVLGETWVALAHRKAIREVIESREYEDVVEYTPAVFTFFLPTAIEYIVKGDETEEELDDLEARGFSLVKVVRAEQTSLEDEDEDDDEVEGEEV